MSFNHDGYIRKTVEIITDILLQSCGWGAEGGVEAENNNTAVSNHETTTTTTTQQQPNNNNKTQQQQEKQPTNQPEKKGETKSNVTDETKDRTVTRSWMRLKVSLLTTTAQGNREAPLPLNSSSETDVPSVSPYSVSLVLQKEISNILPFLSRKRQGMSLSQQPHIWYVAS